MFDENRDLNRDLERRDPALGNPAVNDGSGYGPLVALAAIAVIVGGLFFFAPRSDQTQVATNNAPVTRTAPAPAPVTPAPPTTAPQPQ